ncbi:MAG: NAD(P)-dependent oxidoreductase [Deltaproteobacteria bacterium]|jgi:3-hydroxyisobutyrate dehydrogenase-like beta-hydroxyacid dehydrogenase|nr:NAD(P)-dependent oxidoreductase [Deltaproteobacteria bacterium]MBT4644619.1 NAD(P)-dependent oxidoreductase [Deltaproteobacteria bacterium]MBT6499821.1 NAD(P)-dependent oxidoreductase [Deltaproteobacteria bacterium]MBT7712772.1 NAD(P)-dependent oxidoreductase [Deltaproteobacteria bacterium]MBT7890298.1 NAD(P)-dependent oxidoreductase [Deltaproteobacteria bacterium]
MKFGFIGLGNMGGGLARNLVRAGKETLLFDLSKEAIDKVLAVGDSGSAAGSIDEMAAVDVLFTSLPLPTHLEQVMLGETGLLNKMQAGSTYIDVSTIDPASARKLSDAAAAKGIDFLECPLGKNPTAAEKGEEPIFVGGEKAVYEKMKDLLALVGDPIYYMGTVEASAAFKLISNLMGMTNVAVIAEGFRLGEKAGIEPKMLLELLNDTGAKSFQLDLRGPWLAEGDYANRFGLDLALKDVRLGCEMATEWGLQTKLMETALAYFKEASEAGFGAEDCNAVYKIMK